MKCTLFLISYISFLSHLMIIIKKLCYFTVLYLLFIPLPLVLRGYKNVGGGKFRLLKFWPYQRQT